MDDDKIDLFGDDRWTDDGNPTPHPDEDAKAAADDADPRGQARG